MDVVQVVTLRAREGKADELAPMLEQGRAFALAEGGCQGFDVYQGKDDAAYFVMIERWASVEAHQTHFQKNVAESGVLDRVNELLAEPLRFGYYVQR